MTKINLIKENALLSNLNSSGEEKFKNFCKTSFFEPQTAIVLVKNAQDQAINVDWSKYFDISKLSTAYNEKHNLNGGHLENGILVYNKDPSTLVELVKLLNGDNKGLEVAYLGVSNVDKMEADALYTACQKLSPHDLSFQKAFIHSSFE